MKSVYALLLCLLALSCSKQALQPPLKAAIANHSSFTDAAASPQVFVGREQDAALIPVSCLNGDTINVSLQTYYRITQVTNDHHITLQIDLRQEGNGVDINKLSDTYYVSGKIHSELLYTQADNGTWHVGSQQSFDLINSITGQLISVSFNFSYMLSENGTVLSVKYDTYKARCK